MTILPETFQITFPSGPSARTLRVPTFADATTVADKLGIKRPQSALFLSGGASAMDDESIFKTRSIIEGGIARFAAENNVVVIDGGTDAGIMQMMGVARAKWGNRFPLIGCAPEGKVIYPGLSVSPEDITTRTALEPHHSHFVLVDEDYWGAESDMIVGLTRSISGGTRPNYGVLINGGSIAKYDIYIASARGSSAIPVLVVDGSGRTANEIARASRTGKFQSAMVQAIVQGGKIEEVSLQGGPKMIYKRLTMLFNA